MRFLAVHPGPLMYTEVFLRLEPLGLELVAEAVRRAGHEVRIIDLQVETHAAYFKFIEHWRPNALAFSCNFLANVPEIVDLAKETKRRLPQCFLFVGGHSATFTAHELLEHGDGAIDCVLRGEGESSVARLMEVIEEDREAITEVPGVVTLEGDGPPPVMVPSLDDIRPARDLVRHRRKYFIGHLDPCASIEFSRGCPWDCNFCSAWTFYGRSYRTISPEVAAEELGRIKESGIFIVDDVAFIQSKHGLEIGEAIARKGIKKKFYLETRGDVLLRNKEVFKFWRELGVEYMFLGLEAIDEEGLKKFRKRVSLDQNMEALECARSLGITVAINIIADTDWDRERFEVVRQWCLEVPEVVNISINTPYPGTEIWHTQSDRLTTRDYRLFDIQHAVLPTRLPLEEFYSELLKTQRVMNMKHISWRTMGHLAGLVSQRLIRGQFNFLKMLWQFNKVYNLERLLADHAYPSAYKMALPSAPGTAADRKTLYVHKVHKRQKPVLDKATAQFVEETRLSASRSQQGSAL
ncbi:Cobalamin B12-binding/Radical SAM domain Fe-S oxidoreductase [Nitrosococcus oceani ATCC 19707]|uniref:Cobalamin B12-binding/Radical SAM domain Fe-S oxidoreductase n=2 Tax=Nitrosococcus oceani TaxID=1229 RepID=Q3JAD6_NITOC|nr:hopanoid C-3 methylase HpnR [Nitrosococcus oceani]ABA58210.1 Cobalamin B12-binding/Radical SAM domain Fe-S oxidoreductase [Nitrosococcus oceani ATCC 19707]EDZ67845.1 radical SAM domain protein [Nitrosococcus oceani AFC27]KFI19323.1 cobalamin-binding protein [Nitrosococcus oceani C-27]GEM20430.1 hopanoid C-3 methylase HpnR [Nitrosococcus oceani]